MPRTEFIWINSICSEKLYAMRFQGKPDNILPLTNSKMPMLKENIKIEDNIFFLFIKNFKIAIAIP